MDDSNRPSPRALIPLHHDWRFFQGDPDEAELPWFDDSSWATVSVPHSFNATDTFLPQRGYYRGPAWYRLDLPDFSTWPCVELVSLASFAVTRVWLNGRFVGEFMAGFTGFEAEITGLFRPQGSNILALRVTNEHDPEVLPGKDIPDYNLYGGVYRETFLRLTGPCHVNESSLILRTPQVTASEAVLEVALNVANQRPDRFEGWVEASLVNPEGHEVAGAECRIEFDPGPAVHAVDLRIDVADPQLWSADSPQLYEVRLRLGEEDTILDEVTRRVGFRWFDFDGDRGFSLNGKRLQLRGLNRHQDFPGLANALPANLQSMDVHIIKDLGGNFVRCSHYPMHPAFLDACDELGVLVYEEIASWQHIGGERFAQNAEAMMEAMIRRDSHHPSIILWGLLNEGRDRGLFDRLNRLAKRLDPDRSTIYAENSPDKGVALGTVSVPDVLGLNYGVERLDELRALLPGLKLLSSEHTNADFAARGCLEDEMTQLQRVLHDLDELEVRPWMAGTCLWSMHDYGTDYGVVWPMQKSGILDGWRLPKLAAHALKARWRPEPFVHIVGPWDHRGREREPVHVQVISNADEVELYVNGRPCGPRKSGPVRTWDVPYEPGEIVAVGRGSAGEVKDVRRTPKSPVRTGALQVESLFHELRANGMDTTLITVSVLDEAGTLVPEADRPISLRTYLEDAPGGATVMGVGGHRGFLTRAGQGRIALRAGREPGALRIVAESPAMPDGEITITLVSG